MIIPDALQNIAKELKATGASRQAKVRTVLSWFGFERRGDRVVETIRKALHEVALRTEPDFADREVGVDSFLKFVLESEENDGQEGAPGPQEDLDGLDKGASWGDYPIDGLLIRNETRTVYGVFRRIKQGFYVMDPDFQRDFIWKPDKQSRLIESVIMRIPLPVFYLAEDEEGKMIVVDGLQRLSTFERFLKNDLKLRLPDRGTLHGKRFSDLSPKLKNRIEDCNLTFYIMDARVPERARLDIFERVNGGVALSRQQMRNCLYMGKATRFLKAEARTDLFLGATGRSLRSDTMRDREFVNRFCAFEILGINGYRGDMDQYLADGLQTMNRMEAPEIDSLRRDFRRSLKNNYSIFGKHAFRKRLAGTKRRSVINASLWDVMSTGLAHYGQPHVSERRGVLRTAFRDLLRDQNFDTAITYATNGDKRVRARFRMTQAMLEEVLGDHSA